MNVTTVAAIPSPSAIFREEQNFSWWLYGLLAMMVALCGLGLIVDRGGMPAAAEAVTGWKVEVPLFLLVGMVVPPVLLLGVLHMTTEVDADECRVWFGWLPTYRRSIRLDEVRVVEVVTYRPIRDHGFWGVKVTRSGERVLTARGNRGVRLLLADGSSVLIGSQKVEELAGVIERERRARAGA